MHGVPVAHGVELLRFAGGLVERLGLTDITDLGSDAEDRVQTQLIGPPNYGWESQAACEPYDQNGDLFFPDAQGKQLDKAREICETCAAIGCCLLAALAYRDHDPIRATLSYDQRLELSKALGLSKATTELAVVVAINHATERLRAARSRASSAALASE